MSTMRRDVLMRMIESGRVVLVDSYSFDDCRGVNRNKTERPVKLMPDEPDWWRKTLAEGGRIEGGRIEGVAYLRRFEFTGYGRAHREENGLVTLYVHGNSNYTFREVSKEEHAALVAQAVAAHLEQYPNPVST